MKWRRTRRRVFLVLGAVVTAGVVAAGIALAVLPPGAPIAGPTGAGPRPSAASGAPSANPTAPAPPAPPADVVATTPVGGPVYAGSVLQRVAGCTPSSGSSTPSEALLPGGMLFASCSGRITLVQLSSGHTAEVGVQGDSAFPGTDHVFTTIESTTPAGPLTPARNHYTLQAYEARTGLPAWSADLEPWLQDDGSDATQVVEGPTGDKAHPHGVFVHAEGSTMFDADTGREVWHVRPEGPPGASPADSTMDGATYVGRGVSVASGAPDASYGWTGYDARTGATRWTVRAPGADAGSGEASFVTDDGVQWTVGTDSWVAYDLATGAVSSQGMFAQDAAANGLAVRPGQALLAGDRALALVDLTPVGARPRWTVAGQATPKALTTDYAVVQGPLGVTLLSTIDGSIARTIPGSSMSVQQARDGLVLLEDGTVLKVGQGG